MRTITKVEHVDLYSKTEWEGGLLGGYATYGADLDLIAKLGFDKEKVKAAIDLLESVEEAIYEIQDEVEEDL